MLTPEDVTAGSKALLWWTDTCGHTWQAPVHRMVRRFRCPVCEPKAAPLSIGAILNDCDRFFTENGKWPNRTHGPIPWNPPETWGRYEDNLKSGGRGLPGGSSLARLLEDYRGIQNPQNKPNLTEESILSDCDRFFMLYKAWPSSKDGPIPWNPPETWGRYEDNLKSGGRGLPGGSSLARLLEDYRGIQNPQNKPNLTEESILLAADLFFEAHRRWPKKADRNVPGHPNDTWNAYETALTNGGRGLPGGYSLAKLLAEHRSVRNIHGLKALTEEDILLDADAFFNTMGRWPNRLDKQVEGKTGETWGRYDDNLKRGGRGLPGKSSLANLLVRGRHIRRHKHQPLLSERTILSEADYFFILNDRWPKRTDSGVPGNQEENWSKYNAALGKGLRGLPGGSSLSQLLKDRTPPKLPLRKAA